MSWSLTASTMLVLAAALTLTGLNPSVTPWLDFEAVLAGTVDRALEPVHVSLWSGHMSR